MSVGIRQDVICEYCEKTFERRKLKGHTSRVHGNQLTREKVSKGQGTIGFNVPAPKRERMEENPTPEKIVSEQEEGPCTECYFRFTSDNNLRNHMEIHETK